MTEATDILARALFAKASADIALVAIDREVERLASVIQMADEAYASAPTVRAFVDAELVRQAHAGEDSAASVAIRQMREQNEVAAEHLAEMRKFCAVAREKRDEIRSLADLAAEIVSVAQAIVGNKKPS